MKWLDDAIKFAVCIVIIVGVLAAAGWWTVYKYQDCGRVGHARLYCLLDRD